jgi:hypothetical protein
LKKGKIGVDFIGWKIVKDLLDPSLIDFNYKEYFIVSLWKELFTIKDGIEKKIIDLDSD